MSAPLVHRTHRGVLGHWAECTYNIDTGHLVVAYLGLGDSRYVTTTSALEVAVWLWSE